MTRLPRKRHRIARYSGSFAFGASLWLTGVAWAESPSTTRQSPIVVATQQADPAVVNIQGHKTVRTEPVSTGGEASTQQVNGMGSGVIIDSRGFILTNLHVVQGVADIDVTLASGKRLKGKMIDYDPETDLALVRVDSQDPLPVIRMGTSSDLQRGETVIAIGNPFGYQSTVTTGIISALNRTVGVNGTQEYRDLIQTDASINPGNSGGPLLNILGDMIGINVAVRMGAQGIGFAIPVDQGLDVAANLIERQLKVAPTGIKAKTLREEGSNFLSIEQVTTGSAADTAGFRGGDRILSVNNQPVERRLDWVLALLDAQPGSTVPTRVKRGDEIVELSLSIQEKAKPAPVVAPDENTADLAWNVLGIRTSLVPPGDVQRVSPNYRGGLKVTAIRSGSPASKGQVRVGDILVGILTYETTSVSDLSWILQNASKELRSPQGAKFFVVRGEETLFGAMKVPASGKVTR